jgi:hypothetical protein
MNIIKQKIIVLALIVMGTLAISIPQTVGAACTPQPDKGLYCCGGVQTSLVVCDQTGGKDAGTTQSGVWGILLLTLNILTAGVGIAAVGGITYGAILYTTSSDSAEQTKKAKDVIRNVAIGIVAYASMYLLLNFLIPGGIFQ